MRIIVLRLRKSYFWTAAALAVMGLFWFTGILQHMEIPASGLAPYYHGQTTKAQMTLTINVDWGQEEIPTMLDILEVKGVSATFFITGNWAQKFPELVQEIDQRGHEIGNHGYSHAHPNQLSEKNLIAHIQKNEEILFQLTGKRTNLYAPPYGEYNNQVVKIADRLGYKLIMWSADTIDWQRPTPSVIVERVVRKASRGGIVLMHPIEQTVEALPIMIDQLQNQGYELVTISQLLRQENMGEEDAP